MNTQTTAQRDAVKARGRPRSEASGQAILEATMALLSEQGYRAVTVDAIAARAGASKSTIYRRWPTKENLVIAAFARSPMLVAPGRGSLESRLAALVSQFAGYMQQTPLGRVLPALVAERAHNPALDAALAPLVAARRAGVVAVLREGIAQGELPRGTDPETVVDLLLGPVLQRIMVMGRPVDPRFVKRVVGVVCAGLRATAGRRGGR